MTRFRTARDATITKFASLDRRHFLSATASLTAVVGSGAQAQQATGSSVIAPGWTDAAIPDQTGPVIVITGGNGAPKTIAPGTFPPPGVIV